VSSQVPFLFPKRFNIKSGNVGDRQRHRRRRRSIDVKVNDPYRRESQKREEKESTISVPIKDRHFKSRD
jgi:hypothetical protein